MPDEFDDRESFFPQSRSERIGLGLCCLFLLVIFSITFVVFWSVPFPPDIVAAAILFLLQDVALAIVIYSLFAIIWCVFMPNWLRWMDDWVKTNTMRSVLLFVIAGTIIFIYIGVEEFVL